jgi:DprA-like N-terminal HHH domain
MLRPQGTDVDAVNPVTQLTDAERIDRLRLIRSENVGPRGIMAQTPQAGA